MKGWISDLGFALRTIARKPQSSLMLMATLALGISITTAMFSVLDAVLLRALPYVDPSRVVLLQGVSLTELGYWNNNHTFERIAVYSSGGVNLLAGGAATRAQIAEVSPDYFAVFGVEPIAGAGFRTGETHASEDHIAILSYAFWRRNFNASSSALGATIRINSEPYLVTGVMPAGFAIPGDTALWVPIGRDVLPRGLTRGEQVGLPSYMAYNAIARLRQGVTLPQARREMEDLRQRQAKLYAGTNRGVTSLVGVTPYPQLLVREYRSGLLLLFLAAGMVLLIACANAGGLLFARGAMRRKELAVRMSLGASRWRIVRQLLAESTVIATVSTAATIGLSAILIRSIQVFGPAEVPRLVEATIDFRALAFAVVVSQAAGLVAGLWPAIRSSAVRILPAMQSEGPRSAGQFSSRTRRALIVAEIATAMALTCTAGVALRSLHNLLSVDVGFAREHVLTLRLAPTLPTPAATLPVRANHENSKPTDEAAVQKEKSADAMAERKETLADAMMVRHTMLDTVQRIPGVVYAAETDNLPLSHAHNGSLFIDIDKKIAAADPHVNEIYGDYFAALEIPLLAGRTFDERDVDSSPFVCVVNAKLAAEFGGVTEATGKQFKLEGPDTVWQIVGVVADSLTASLDEGAGQELYLPAAQNAGNRPNVEVAIILRVAGDPQGISMEVTRQLQRVFVDAPPFQVQTLDRVISDSVAGPRFRGELLGGFATLGMALALAGIYGVITYSVTTRTHEIGIRLALGAERSRILQMVLAEGLKLGIVGILLGFGVAWSLKKYVASLVFGVQALDPLTVSAAALLLLGVSLLACAAPARRASRVDPVTALRFE
ncbi:MAG TPA: ABC transporter permease [Candidatus Acidoferrales bacterium]|nr:ABC transporter permease [Candidatus Acidoferrales bacterium]